MSRFQGCRDRIERATIHHETLAQLWNDWADEDPYNFYVDVRDDGTGILSVEPRNYPMPHDWALELGELLYHLRAALDGAVYESAIIKSGQNPPPGHKSLEFPIYSKQAAFAQHGVKKIGALSQKCQDFIESIQPYRTPQLQPDLTVFNVNRNLFIINDWARKDRHRTLHVVGAWASTANPQLRLPSGATLKYLHATGDGFLDERRSVAEFAIEGYVRGMNVRANPDQMIEMAVKEEPKPLAENDTLENRLTGMVQTTEIIVLALENLALDRSLTPPTSGTQI
jgi:hypothetical protein